MSSSTEEGQLQDYSVDQVAGAFVLILSAISSLLLVLWQSKCHCRVNLCYLFQCSRSPPNEEEIKGLKEQYENSKKKKENEILKKENEILKKEDEILTQRSPRRNLEPEPEPEIIIPPDNP